MLPIGGLKEKILGCEDGHMETVLVPEKNRADIAELSKEITKGLNHSLHEEDGRCTGRQHLHKKEK